MCSNPGASWTHAHRHNVQKNMYNTYDRGLLDGVCQDTTKLSPAAIAGCPLAVTTQIACNLFVKVFPFTAFFTEKVLDY